MFIILLVYRLVHSVKVPVGQIGVIIGAVLFEIGPH